MQFFCLDILSTCLACYVIGRFLSPQGLAKLLEDQHGYIDLQNIPENKYFSMSQSPNDDEEKI